MPKPLLGILLGAAMGFIDGLTSWFTPESEKVFEIAAYSGAKGLIVGVIVGFYARKVDSIQKGVVFGVVVALILSFAVALMNYLEVQSHYWVEIMLPGTITGAIVGYGVQKFGAKGKTAESPA
jgi:ABC-type Mn2+/Zn2+ transport system permease subunit